MGMRKTMMKGMSYAVAPKAAFTVFNPKKTAFAKATGWAMSSMFPRRRNNTMAMTAAKGFGAAAIAVPLGMWIGRKIWHGDQGSTGGQQ